jgi:hypothetical protein
LKNGYCLGTSNWDICYDANLKAKQSTARKKYTHWLDVRQDKSMTGLFEGNVSTLSVKNQVLSLVLFYQK